MSDLSQSSSTRYPFKLNFYHRSSELDKDSNSFFKQYMMEFCMTFLLVLSITCHRPVAKSSPTDPFKPGIAATLYSELHPLSVAATIILIVSVGAPVSGAHYNPALSMGFWFCGDRGFVPNVKHLIGYILTQLAAAVAGIFAGFGFDGFQNASLPALGFNSAAEWALVGFAEGLCTFLCVLYVIYAAKINTTLGTFGPVGVGLVFFTCINSFANISGSVFNPALCFALWVSGMAFGVQPNEAASILVIFFSDLLGGILAGVVAKLILNEVEATKKRKEAYGAAPTV